MQPKVRPNHDRLVIGIVVLIVLATIVSSIVGFVVFAKTMMGVLTEVEVTNEATAEIFPQQWHDHPRLKPIAEPLNDAEAVRVISLVKKELKRYPSPVTQLSLSTVYCLKSLTFYGNKYPSAYSDDSIYIVDEGPAKGFDEKWLEDTFHFEMGDILLYNYLDQFDSEEWMKLLPEGFEYDGEGKLEAGNVFGTQRDEKWLKQGFVTEYGTFSIDRDFAQIAAGLMAGHYEFYAHAKRHPVLMRKVEFAAKFYRDLGIKVPDYSL